MFIYIGGVPGVGKTTILTNMERLAADRGLKLERVVGTKILCELTGAKTVEELRVLPEEIRAKHRQRLNEILYERDR